MDWTTVLKAQQADFIQRLKLGYLLRCEKKGLHSELTVIHGDSLKQIRDFCWKMADKFKYNDPVRKIFINNMQGKLAEEVVKARLAGMVGKVDYEVKRGGDGQVDFRLNSDTSIGIQVKSRQCWNNLIDQVSWSITEEEIKKNSILVCILIQGKLEDDQAKKFNLIFAGFLPTNMMKIAYGKSSVGINELLYAGGLQKYLTSLASPKNNNSQELLDYVSLGSLCYQKGNYLEAINNYNHALKTNLNLVKTYYCRGLAYLALQNKQQSIKDFTDAIKIDSNFAPAYYNRGLVYCYIEKREVAIADFTEAIKINPNYVAAYMHRGQTLVQIGEKQGALADFQKVADLYLKQGRQADYQNTLNTITKLLHS